MSRCGGGTVVATVARGPGFESSYQQPDPDRCVSEPVL